MFDAGMILKQLGGNKFIAMTGAKNFVRNDAKQKLSFKIGRGAREGINVIHVTLTPADVYEMEFVKMRGVSEPVVVRNVTDVYADALQETFTEVTGMDTYL